MEKDVFSNKEIYDRFTQAFYPVELDAETVEDITFDQQIWKSKTPKKNTAQYHPLALLLLTSQKMVFPSLLRYDQTFKLKSIKQKYLSPKELANFLR